jgi:hypothetical protein
VSRNVPRLQFLGEGRAGTVGERCRPWPTEPVCCVSIEKRQQRRISATAGQVEKRRREYERVLAGRKPQGSTEEAFVLARIAWRAMCESHLGGTPARASGNAAGAHPRRKEQLGRLTGCRHTTRQAV